MKNHKNNTECISHFAHTETAVQIHKTIHIDALDAGGANYDLKHDPFISITSSCSFVISSHSSAQNIHANYYGKMRRFSNCYIIQARRIYTNTHPQWRRQWKVKNLN